MKTFGKKAFGKALDGVALAILVMALVGFVALGTYVVVTTPMMGWVIALLLIVAWAYFRVVG